ncbi:MAG: acyl-CoA dehydrogenase family protein [Bacillota bacterium]
MDFSLNEDQVMLKKTVRSFMEDHCPTTFVREIMEDPLGYSPKIWQDMAELGWTALTIPEEYDGIGLGFMDLVVVMEEMGRAVLPAPFLETILAAEAILMAGNEVQKKEYLPQIACGELIATVAIDEPAGYWTASAVNAKAVPDGDGYKVSGTKLFVPYANAAGLIVCAVRTATGACPTEGVTLVLIDPKADGVTLTDIKAMDEAYRLFEIQLDNVAVSASQVLGEAGKGWSVLEKVIQKAAVALAAETVGGAERATEIAVQYSKERIQFGKPIGTNQALKHKAADMIVAIENDRSAAYYAGWAVDTGAPDAAIAASAAKACGSDTYTKCTTEAIQILGGIGFTWEHDMHLFYKRALRVAVTCGDASFHREQLIKHWLGV